MSITPLDIENTKFRGSLGGYNRNEVDLLLAKVSQELEARLAQIEELQRRITQLEQTVATYRESEDLLKNSVVLAQRTSDEIIAAAHQQADAILREAESSGRETTRRLGELKAEREQFEYAFHGLLAGFLHRLEQGNPALGERRRPTPELQAPAGPPAEAPAREPASHSEQLLSEAAGSSAVPQGVAAPADAPSYAESPPTDTPTPRPSDPEQKRDEFEQAIAAARPAPREEWPAADAPPVDTEQEDSTPEKAEEEPPEIGGVRPMPGVDADRPPAENDDESEEEQDREDRLPLD